MSADAYSLDRPPHRRDRRGGFSESGELTGIEREVAELARRADGRLRVCYLPNASGDQVHSIERFHQTWAELDAELSVLTLFRREVDDITAHLRGQDLIFVGGGSAANLMALWHLHGVPGAIRAAYRDGVFLAGVSAGGICWHAHGVTTTFSRRTPTIVDGLGLIDATFCPHWQRPERRQALEEHLLRGGGVGFGCADHGAIHYVNGQPYREMQDSGGVRVAYLRVDPGDGVIEEELQPGPLDRDLIA
ncbi:MAG TPA: Type 1 glutamine amidotransferase-like domain-containing protein [Solirubrobacterales bacterium]|nr:Type 1 glutamine amidotransferase-like domain-containing protein [Solirubrobacterales bacterium]